MSSRSGADPTRVPAASRGDRAAAGPATPRGARGWAAAAWIVGLSALLAACSDGARSPDTGGPRGAATVVGDASLTGAVAAVVGKETAATGGFVIETTDRELVRLFYRAVLLVPSPATTGWTGDVSRCLAGDVSVGQREASLRRINGLRALAGVPGDVAYDGELNRRAQETALLMAANDQIDHQPPSSWRCYTASAASGAGQSNLALGIQGAESIDGYLREPGASNFAVGHRRWILLPTTRHMGIGDAGTGENGGGSRTSALWVFDPAPRGARPVPRDEFVAWPPRGHVPYPVVPARWSFSWPGADFSGARVTVTENGRALPVRLEPVAGGYGDNTLVFLPGNLADSAAWPKPSVDTVYDVRITHVRIEAATRDFQYTVTVFDPEVASGPAPSLQGAARLTVGESADYTITPMLGAAQYQWRSLTTEPYPWVDGAEAGGSDLEAATSAGYSVLDDRISATGARSYHLAHVSPTDQVLRLRTTVLPGAGGAVRFASRLGLSSSAQTARLELSEDDGLSWRTLWEQAGRQTGSTTSLGESSFTEKVVSLSAWAGRTVQLRWRYALDRNAGAYYPQATVGVGWYIDDIRLTDTERVGVAGAPRAATLGVARFTAETTGTVRLQARAGLFGGYAEWGATMPVSVQAAAVTPVILGGTAGDDRFTPGPSPHRIDGAGGWDTVVVGVVAAGTRVGRVGTRFRVVPSGQPGATWELNRVERLQFADVTVDLVPVASTGTPGYGLDDGFLFDPVYYRLAHQGAVPAEDGAARAHYFASGAARGWAPTPWFDATYYRQRWPDLGALGLDDATLFRHYNRFGVWEGRSPGPAFDRFDGERYLRENPDVAAYVDAHLPDFLGSRRNGAIAHFLLYGAPEGRLAYDEAGAPVGRDFDLVIGS